MANGWTKIYTSGAMLFGSDEDVTRGKASWSKSSLVGMSGASILHNSYTIEIYGEGDYWQADRWVSSMSTGRSTMIKRMLRRKIQPEDTHFRVSQTPRSLTVVFNDALTIEGKWSRINPKDVGKWLVVEHDITTKHSTYYFKEY